MRCVVLVFLSLIAAGFLLTSCAGTDRMSRRPSASQHDSAKPRTDGAVRSTSATATTHLPLPRGHHVVLGDAVATDYGPVQVRVTTLDGRIVDLDAVELPHAAPLDRQLSFPAATTLRRQVLQAQSADVDSVSGATYTSAGYLQSLESALRRLRRS
jgi:uncharacterized protein with FMN-binding domain